MVPPPPILRELRALPGVAASADVPLAPLTTIRTGGKAAVLVTIDEVPAVVEVLRIMKRSGLAWYCLGAGSDLLVADEGYPGAVVRLGPAFDTVDGLPTMPPTARMSAAKQEGTPPERARGGPSDYVITAGGGALLAQFAAAVAEAGLAGLDFACGIPGTVGGGVATNAGAYGRSLADVLSEVELASAEGVRWVPAADLGWGYRHCRLPEGVVVTAARFRLRPGEPGAIHESHCAILEMRRDVQPQGVFTFGSTFKNPSGGAAGRLLEAAGLKGERRGGAEVSRVHANFVVNLGDASTADVLALLNHMRQRVHETSGVWLEPEVRLLGTTFPWESSAGGSRRLPPADG